jgi:hypothetical protein
MNMNVLCIDVIETPQGFKILFEDEFLEDDNGAECWKTFAEAIEVLKAQLEVTA